MSQKRPDRPQHPGDGFDRGWDGHRRRQARLGLTLTPAQRLLWLERTMAEMRLIQGRARSVKPRRPE